MPEPIPHIVFSHGKESGPWGTKIARLAEIGRTHGFAVSSPDYTHTMDPHERLQQLLTLRPEGAPLVLAGSSMGGYVAAHACRTLTPDALFLMAPALYFPGWDEEPTLIPKHCHVVHGRHDEIVPPQTSKRFCETHGAQLILLDAGHALTEALEAVDAAFTALLQRLHTLRVPQ